ncbi:MAG: peptidoglycan/xylan/chitin deacetylase (PgdA/CDA1 family) [Sphingobacteriales bacterium]
MYLIKSPFWLQALYPGFIWHKSRAEKVIYLTFDDGPIPEVTPWVLNELKRYEAKATFFCIGDNIQKHPNVFQKVKDQGHQIGNHTNNHLNGWGTKPKEYRANWELFQKKQESELFRPPYGKITRLEAVWVQKTMKVVMWDVLSADFDPKVTPEKCLSNVLGKCKYGSIVVFHDSIKSFENLKYTLPKVLEHFSSLGYTFKSL